MIPHTPSDQGIHAHTRLSRLRAASALVQPAAVSGASLTDYSLVIGLIAAVAITSVATLGDKGRAVVCSAQNTISAALGGDTGDCAPTIAGGAAAGDGDEAADIVPDAFSFGAAPDLLTPGETAVSSAIMLTGFNQAIEASIALDLDADPGAAVTISLNDGSPIAAPASFMIDPETTVVLSVTAGPAHSATHTVTMIAGGVSGSFAVATTSANQAPVFTGDPNLGTVAFPWNAPIAVAATDADADTITYAIDPSSATIWPFLSIDANTGAISVDRVLVETDAFAANPQIAFTVTATDDRAVETAANPGDPDQGALTTTKVYTMDIGLPADCDALLAGIPGLTDGPAGIDPRLIPGAGAGVDGPIQTWCDVDVDPVDGVTPVAWTMVAAFPPAPQGGAPRYGNTLNGGQTGADGIDPNALSTTSLVDMIEGPAQAAPAKLSDETWSILGDVTRVRPIDQTEITAPYSPTIYISYGDKAWPTDGARYKSASDVSPSGFPPGNPYANQQPACSTDFSLWMRGRGFEMGDCYDINSNHTGMFALGVSRGHTAIFPALNESTGGLAFARRASLSYDPPPQVRGDVQEYPVLYDGLRTIRSRVDLDALFKDPLGRPLTYTLNRDFPGGAITGSTLFLETDSSTVRQLHILATNSDGQSANGRFYIRGGAYAQSCQEIYTRSHGQIAVLDGADLFTKIDPDGEGAGSAQRVQCHFETSGPLEGGWTVAAYQREDSPVTNWNAGISTNRSAATYFDSSFALSSTQIPPHNHTAFGRKFLANGSPADTTEILDGVAMTYATGDIDRTGAAGGLPGLVRAETYDIHRQANQFFGYHNPERTASVDETGIWAQTLTFDRVSGGATQDLTWSFSPNHPIAGVRGYGYDAFHYGQLPDPIDNTANDNSSLNFGWVVLVR